jgi:hypothetical protein
LALVALFAILDPPREEAIEAARVAHQAGITVKMITGGGAGWFLVAITYSNVLLHT